MPKKSRAKSSPVRKDFFYYLPLITSIVVNLFWAGFSVCVLLPFFWMGSAVSEVYEAPKGESYVLFLIPIVWWLIFLVTLLYSAVLRNFFRKSLYIVICFYYVLSLLGAVWLASKFGFGSYILSRGLFDQPVNLFLHLSWFVSLLLSIVSAFEVEDE